MRGLALLRALGLGLALVCPLAAGQVAREGVAPGVELGQASLVLEPSEVAIGEPFELSLSVVHAQRDPLLVPEAGFLPAESAASWLQLDSPRLWTERLPESSLARTTIRIALMMIEPGEHELWLSELHTQSGELIELPAAQLSVRAELAEGEDQARPLPDFHAPPSADWPVGPLPVFGALALCALALWLWRRRRGAPAHAPQELAPLELLGRLKAARQDDAESVHALCFEIARLLRAAVDRHLGRERPAQEDGEWLAGVERELPSSELFEEVRAILRECEVVKFAGETPTRFAIDERLERLERVLARLPEREEAA